MKWEELSILMEAVDVHVMALESDAHGDVHVLVVPHGDEENAVGSLEWAGFEVSTAEWEGFGNKPRRYNATEIKLTR